jgi:nucleoside-diphosphate-sugar epimerase
VSILITGNKGFIGSGLKGSDGIDLKTGTDIVTYKATKKYNSVVHTAAKTSVTDSMDNPEEYIRTNIAGTLNLLRQHPESHFVYLSTASVYGEGEDHTVDSPLNPTSIYTITKLAGEFLVRSLAKSWVILRLTNVIGDGERGEPNVYQIFKRSEVIPVYGDGLQTRDFVDVDIVRKIIMIATYAEENCLFNIGSGVSVPIIEVAKKFNKPIKFFPARPGEIRKFGVADAFRLNTD